MENNNKNLDKKTRILYSSYLALGSIALYSSLGLIVLNIISPFFHLEISSLFTTIFLGTVILFLAGILLIITYYGFFNSKKYPKVTGVVGCISLLIFYGFYFFDNHSLWTISYHIGDVFMVVAAVVLLIFTLRFWKKL